MKHLFLIFTFLLTACNHTGTSRESPGMLADDLISQVQKTLLRVQDAQDEEDSGLPALKTVSLTLSTYFEVKDGGKLNLYVFTIGASKTRANSQTLTLNLNPPKPGEGEKVSTADFSQNLANSIIEIARAAKKAESGKPPLIMDSLVAEVKFVITSEGSGGAKFTIAPVGAELGRSAKGIETHSLKITFTDAKGEKDSK